MTVAITTVTKADSITTSNYHTIVVDDNAAAASRIEALLPALLPYPSIAIAEATAQDVAMTFHDALEMIGRYTYRTRCMDGTVAVIHAENV